KPIRYDAHCAACHPLTISLPVKPENDAARHALMQFGRTPAPHQPPEMVRAVLRDRLTQLIRSTPSLLSQPSTATIPARPIPGAKPVRPEEVSREEFEWVGRQFIEAEKPLFGSNSQSGCGYCHQRIAPDMPREGDLPRFAASRINSRTF